MGRQLKLLRGKGAADAGLGCAGRIFWAVLDRRHASCASRSALRAAGQRFQPPLEELPRPARCASLTFSAPPRHPRTRSTICSACRAAWDGLRRLASPGWPMSSHTRACRRGRAASLGSAHSLRAQFWSLPSATDITRASRRAPRNVARRAQAGSEEVRTLSRVPGIKKLLVANRGEIAIRVFRAAKVRNIQPARGEPCPLALPRSADPPTRTALAAAFRRSSASARSPSSLPRTASSLTASRPTSPTR